MDWNGRWQSILYKINQYELMCMNLLCCGHMSYIYGLFISFFFLLFTIYMWFWYWLICCTFVFCSFLLLVSIWIQFDSRNFLLHLFWVSCVCVCALSGWCACAREIFVSKMSHWRWPNVLYFLYCPSPYTYLQLLFFCLCFILCVSLFFHFIFVYLFRV